MPTKAKFYAFMVIATGVATLAFAAALWSCPSPMRFLTCLCLTLLGSTFKVKLPSLEGSISPSFVPLLFAAGTLSWPETVLMAAAAGIFQTLWKPTRTPTVLQVAFNGANLAIAMGAGFAVSHAVGANQILVQLAVAVMVFEVINTFTVSTIVCLVTGARLESIWRNCHLWTFPYHLGGAVLAAVWTLSDPSISLSLTALGAVTLYLLSAFYRELVTRLVRIEATA